MVTSLYLTSRPSYHNREGKTLKNSLAYQETVMHYVGGTAYGSIFPRDIQARNR